jgi:hypothetical protein
MSTDLTSIQEWVVSITLIVCVDFLVFSATFINIMATSFSGGG